MSDNFLGHFLLILSLLFFLTYILAGLLERVRVVGILAALFVAIAVNSTFIGDFLKTGTGGEVFEVLANLGVLFLLFFIGLQIDIKEMRRQSGEIVLASFLNTLIPFLMGMSVMLYLGYGWLLAFVIGITRMPTAEAVIVPILEEFDLIRTKIT